MEKPQGLGNFSSTTSDLDSHYRGFKARNVKRVRLYPNSRWLKSLKSKETGSSWKPLASMFIWDKDAIVTFTKWKSKGTASWRMVQWKQDKNHRYWCGTLYLSWYEIMTLTGSVEGKRK